MKDGFGRNITYMRMSVTDLCSLRCRYCIPEEGVCKKKHSDILTEEEMIMAVEAAASLGVNKLRITGGEPLTKPNIISICERSAAVLGIETVCITTNALLLKEMAVPLKKAGVKRVNISLDTLKDEKYTYMTRGGSIKKALEGLEAALEAGFDAVKINAVLIGGFNDDEIEDLASLTLTHPLDVRFIELMPMYDSGDFRENAFISVETVKDKLQTLRPVESDGGVAKLYSLPGARGRVGLISPLSSHFCGSCNRIRLTPDGKIKPCLHREDEFSLKGLGREEMKRVIETSIMKKPRWHGELSYSSRSRSCRNMNEIGG